VRLMPNPVPAPEQQGEPVFAPPSSEEAEAQGATSDEGARPMARRCETDAMGWTRWYYPYANGGIRRSVDVPPEVEAAIRRPLEERVWELEAQEAQFRAAFSETQHRHGESFAERTIERDEVRAENAKLREAIKALEEERAQLRNSMDAWSERAVAAEARAYTNHELAKAAMAENERLREALREIANGPGVPDIYGGTVWSKERAKRALATSPTEAAETVQEGGETQ
jgi:hypothetical protein